MPTYEYACETCGTFAAMHPIAERDRATDCPRCERPAPRVMGSGPHVSSLKSGRRSGSDGSYARLTHMAGCVCCT